MRLPNTRGRWGFSRVVTEASTLPGAKAINTTAAQLQGLGGGSNNYYAPYDAANSRYFLPFALVNIEGAIDRPTSDTIILPAAPSRIRDLSQAERSNLYNFITSNYGDYSFTDRVGEGRIKTAFSVSRYNLDTTIQQILEDLFDHMEHGRVYDLGALEVHNTEYTDDFGTDPASRWNNPDTGNDYFSWDNTNDELDFSLAGNDIFAVYSANNSGSMDHESQVTTLCHNGTERRVIGCGVRMYDNATEEGYAIWGDANASNILIGEKQSGGSFAVLATQGTTTFTDGNFYTFTLAAEGVGATVTLSGWLVDETGTKPASDPGWTTSASPPATTVNHPDSSPDRLINASNHVDCGIASATAIAGDYDTRHDYFKLRAISDRAGGAASIMNQIQNGNLGSDLFNGTIL